MSNASQEAPAKTSKEGGEGHGTYSDLALYRRLLRQARPYRLHILGLFLLSLLSTPLALLAPLPLKIAVDSVLGDEPLPGFVAAIVPSGWTQSVAAGAFMVAAMVVLVALASLLIELVNGMLNTFVGERLVLDFRLRLFHHAQRLSLSYHDMKGTADSTYRIQYDAPSIQSILIGMLIPMIAAAVMLVSMIYVTARINLQLALVALAVSPVLLALTWIFRGRLKDRWREVKKLESSAQSVIQEVLTAMRVVKAFRREEHEQERFTERSEEGVVARLVVALQEHCYGLLVGLVVAVGTAVVLFIGVHSVQAGTLTLGDLLLVMAYLKQLYAPVKTIGKQLAAKQRALASAERAFALLDEFPEVDEEVSVRPLARARGAIEFREVSFAYNGEGSLLDGVSLDIAAGTRVGIVGMTGAGKTTLMNLLMRFYDPTAGRIFIDGVDIRNYRLGDLRNQFGIVLQEPVLFSTTIAENIAYGCPDATDREIVEAAKAANAHDFIVDFPEGYETTVGERGMRLSGGERQRISLARAFLRNAPILVLDEPTSSVDVETERVIIEAVERLMEGRTTFTIAHRLSTIEHCDIVLRVEDGEVRPTEPEDADSYPLKAG